MFVLKFNDDMGGKMFLINILINILVPWFLVERMQEILTMKGSKSTDCQYTVSGGGGRNEGGENPCWSRGKL